MKKQIKEAEFIGGLGSLTKVEERALSKHFTKKKITKAREISVKPNKK